MTRNTVPVTAMIPAHARIDQTIDTLFRLKACDPAPRELIAHVAESQLEMIDAIRSRHPDVVVLTSSRNLGPGGARNKMLAKAESEIVASFDDDSYPDDAGFFGELIEWFERMPEASIFALNIYEPDDVLPDNTGNPVQVPDFVGCGCAYRRSHFLETDGYVPIPIAYSMEEVDLGIRYLDKGRKIFFLPALRIYHDTKLSHHQSARVAAYQVANTALFPFLRYPVTRWPLAMAQLGNKWQDCLRRGRVRGALLSVPLIFAQIWRYRRYRDTVSAETLSRFRELRRKG